MSESSGILQYRLNFVNCFFFYYDLNLESSLQFSFELYYVFLVSVFVFLE